MLRVDKVCKVFESARGAYIALDGVSLTINDGEFVCLLGPSGCGKSTLLNILAGFEPATSGTVTSDDIPVIGAGRDRMMFFQDAGSALFPWQTVEQNVRCGLKLQKIQAADQEQRIATNTLHLSAKYPSRIVLPVYRGEKAAGAR